MVLHLSVIKGQITDSSADVRSPLNEDRMISESDILESRVTTAYQSASSPLADFSTTEVTPTVPPSSQSSKDAVVHNDTSPSPAISQTPALQDVTTLNTDTASAPGTSASSPTVSNLKSTVLYSVVTSAPSVTSISPSEGPRTVSASASGVTQKTQTAPPFTVTYPQTSQVTLTSSSKATGPAPLEKDQDEPSELDVGDQESGKVSHRPSSPLDPLLAALVTIFIICTAMVSAVLFLRFRQRSEHPEFHRLQDLPMDDLLEDTPLSRYTY
ncbi:hypothetical protein Q8A67_009441 [Cirrhinus molitorella]|uniref:Flocculation protein FLO11-like n=1 Tax=Cirrhinus molitorella TaxID=172907 RepID=A0AA88TTA6_9TELE|nr:hypothetical protein Q8A67_009441 [Cirrhinus molitorella]